MPITRVLLLAAFVSAAPCAVRAQTASQQAAPAETKTFVFEVASIRPAKQPRGYGIQVTPDGAKASGSPLKWIIRSAYNEKRDALWFGEPEWTDSTFYDIEAKFDPAVYKDLTDNQRLAMIQTLLADRFKLTVHRETRILPIYTLVTAKGGPKLRESLAANYMVDSLDKPYCRAGLTYFRQCTMAEFAVDATSIFRLDRIVDDRTGLSSRYDFELNYSTPGMVSDDSPSIFNALPEQLGLRLEPTKRPVSVFVIDHVERPSDN